MKKTLIVLALVAGALFLAFRLLFGGWTTEYRQRLTITVETPAGEVSGSAVTEVRIVDSSGPLVLPDARGSRGKVRGEAVAVEVLPGKWLFALLGTNGAGPTSATAWAQVTFAPERDANNDARQHSERMKDIKRQPYDTPVPLPPEALPLMVTFTDIADPASVERVNLNDLEATFGPGVRLKAVTLEVTRAGVTEGQAIKIMPWLKEIWPRQLDGDSTMNIYATNRLANSLGAGSFSTEIFK